MSLTPTAFHPATDALVAFVDGELSAAAHARAGAHVARCMQCAADVAAQREAKSALRDTCLPFVPADLLSRLRDLPFTTVLPEPDLDAPGPGRPFGAGSGATATSAPAAGGSPHATFSGPTGGFLRSVAPPDRRAAAAPGDRRPPGVRTAAERFRPSRSPLRLRRLRRRLLLGMAGFAVSVLAAAVAPLSTTSGVGAADQRQVGRVQSSTVSVSRDAVFTDAGSSGLLRPVAPSGMSSLLSVTAGRR